MWRMWLVTAVAVLIAASVVVGWAAKLTVNGGTLQVFTFPVDLGPVAATIDIDPDSLNPGSQGNFVMAYIELPPGYDVADIDVSTVTLEVVGVDGSSVPAELSPTEVGDHDEDGIPDLMVKFDRPGVIDLLGGEPGDVTFRVEGEVSGSAFEGTDTIRVLDSQGDAADAEPAAATPTPSPIPVPTASATPVPTASATPVPTASATPVPTASATPVPTASPTPSATPVPAPGGIYVSVTCQGQPVAGAEVSIIGLYRQETVAWSGGTGDDGELSTGLVLNAGTYLVDIVKQGASYDSVIATVPAGAYAPVYAQCMVEWGTGYRD